MPAALVSTLARFVQDGTGAVLDDPDSQIEAIEPIHFFTGAENAMQSNDEESSPATSERDQARARLARQIGRLLAHEWLRNVASPQTDSPAIKSAVKETEHKTANSS